MHEKMNVPGRWRAKGEERRPPPLLRAVAPARLRFGAAPRARFGGREGRRFVVGVPRARGAASLWQPRCVRMPAVCFGGLEDFGAGAEGAAPASAGPGGWPDGGPGRRRQGGGRRGGGRAGENAASGEHWCWKSHQTQCKFCIRLVKVRSFRLPSSPADAAGDCASRGRPPRLRGPLPRARGRRRGGACCPCVRRSGPAGPAGAGGACRSPGAAPAPRGRADSGRSGMGGPARAPRALRGPRCCKCMLHAHGSAVSL